VAFQLVKVEGTDKLQEAAARLKQAGRVDLQRGLIKAIRTSSAEAVDDLRGEVRGLDIDGQPLDGLSERARTAKKKDEVDEDGNPLPPASRGSGARARVEHQLARSSNRDKAYARVKLRSGLREATARATSPTIKVGGASVRVRIRVARNQLPADQWRLPKHLNKGVWRHPVFGNREVWVAQTTIPPGWFDRTLAEHGPQIRTEIDREIDHVMAQL
jgi:hypothetical protein